MADQKITQLTELTTPVDADVLPIVDDPAGTPITKKITWANIKSVIATAFKDGGSNEIDADEFGSGAAADGEVLTADGAGGAAWEAAAGGGATLTTTWGIPPYVASTVGNTAMNTNTTGYTGLFTLTGDITVNKLSIFAQGVSVAGTFDIGIYSEDGQTKHIDITTASISAQGVVTTAVSAVALSAGNYYVVIVPNATAEITVECFNYLGTGNSMLTVSSEPIHSGTQTVTASTLPATFDPVNDITVADGNGPVIRLDN